MGFVRGALIRAGLMVGGLAVGLLLAEGVVRLISPSPGADLFFGAPDAVPPGLYTSDRDLGTTLRPGYQATVETLDYKIPIRINRFGMRGPEPASSAAHRWLAVGDSFVLALQVREEETFSARISAKRSMEMLNGGVDSYAPPQYVTRYRKLAEQFPVEGVVMVFFLGNDFGGMRPVGPGPGGIVGGPPAGPANAGPPGAGGPPPPGGFPGGRPGGAATMHVREPGSALRLPPISRFLFKHSAIYAFARVAQRRTEVLGKGNPDGWRYRHELEIFSNRHADELRQAIRQAEGALMAFRDQASRMGDMAMVAIAPASFAMDGRIARDTLTTFGFTAEEVDVDTPGRLLVDAVKAIGLPVCDLTPPLRASHAAGAPPYFRFDGHWNRVGHAVVAEAVGRCLDTAFPGRLPAATP